MANIINRRKSGVALRYATLSKLTDSILFYEGLPLGAFFLFKLTYVNDADI